MAVRDIGKRQVPSYNKYTVHGRGSVDGDTSSGAIDIIREREHFIIIIIRGHTVFVYLCIYGHNRVSVINLSGDSAARRQWRRKGVAHAGDAVAARRGLEGVIAGAYNNSERTKGVRRDFSRIRRRDD